MIESQLTTLNSKGRIMSTKRTIDTYHAVVNGDMSSSITSPLTDILNADRVSYQISFTGSPTGTFSVQISNDKSIWEDMTLSVAITAVGSPDNHFIDCETAAKYIRLVYTRASGSGVLNVKLVAKSISG